MGMKDGTTFVDKWLGWVRKSFFFVERGEVKIKKIRFISINKPRIENGS